MATISAQSRLSGQRFRFQTRCSCTNFLFHSDLDAAAAAAAAMGLEMPTHVLSKSVPKVKSQKSKSADPQGKSVEIDNEKRREDLRSTGTAVPAFASCCF